MLLLPYLLDWRGRDLADDLVWSGLDMIADQLGGSGSKTVHEEGNEGISSIDYAGVSKMSTETRCREMRIIMICRI